MSYRSSAKLIAVKVRHAPSPHWLPVSRREEKRSDEDGHRHQRDVEEELRMSSETASSLASSIRWPRDFRASDAPAALPLGRAFVQFDERLLGSAFARRTISSRRDGYDDRQ